MYLVKKLPNDYLLWGTELDSQNSKVKGTEIILKNFTGVQKTNMKIGKERKWNSRSVMSDSLWPHGS